MRIIWADFKRELKSTMRYKSNFMLMFVTYLAIMFMALMGMRGGNFDGFTVAETQGLFFLGFLLWTFSGQAVNASAFSVQGELIRGTFYQKLYSKVPVQVLSLSNFFSNIVVQGISAILLTIIAYFAFDVHISMNPMMILSAFISLLGMYGIGLILGGISLYYKQSNGTAMIMQFALYMFGDIVPGNSGLQKITQFIPLASGNMAMREYAAGSMSMKPILHLVLVSAGWFIIGYFVFEYMLHKAKKTGNLLMY